MSKKWQLWAGTETQVDWIKTVTTNEHGRDDLYLMLEFNTKDGSCKLTLNRDGEIVGQAQDIAWEQGLMTLERDGHDSDETVEDLYDHA